MENNPRRSRLTEGGVIVENLTHQDYLAALLAQAMNPGQYQPHWLAASDEYRAEWLTQSGIYYAKWITGELAAAEARKVPEDKIIRKKGV